MKTKSGNAASPEANCCDPEWSVVDLLHFAADDWEKQAGRYMDNAQKADKTTAVALRMLAESRYKWAKRARELAGAKKPGWS